MPERPADQPDLNPARIAADPLLHEIADLVGYLDLHIGRYQIRQMTTRQKELWSDLVDANAVIDASQEATMSPPRRSVRWWRDTPARPVGEEGHQHGEQAACRGCGKAITWDADIEAFWIPYGTGNPPYGAFHCPGTHEPHWALPDGAEEPDPFLYEDEGGTRRRQIDIEADVEPAADGMADHVNQVAVGVARSALLDVIVDSAHPERVWLASDFAAVYEWAKRCPKPIRMTTGERAGEIGSLRAYPSLNDARAFLARHRDARRHRDSS